MRLAGSSLARRRRFTVVMLQKAGVDGGEAAAALTASTGLQITTALALPLPAIIGGAPINRGLATAAYLGAVVVLLIGAGAVLFKADAPLEWIHFLPPVSQRTDGSSWAARRRLEPWTFPTTSSSYDVTANA
jgi:hypothetical protein